MNIEKWIEENRQHTYVDDLEVYGEDCISIDTLEQLLKTHAIVPRNPTHNMAIKGSMEVRLYDSNSTVCRPIAVDAYKAMIKAAEND